MATHTDVVLQNHTAGEAEVAGAGAEWTAHATAPDGLALEWDGLDV